MMEKANQRTNWFAPEKQFEDLRRSMASMSQAGDGGVFGDG